jgi:hypothetical protein
MHFHDYNSRMWSSTGREVEYARYDQMKPHVTCLVALKLDYSMHCVLL